MPAIAFELASSQSRARALARFVSGLGVGSWIALDSLGAAVAMIAAHAISPSYLGNPLAPPVLSLALVYGGAFAVSAFALGLHDPSAAPGHGTLLRRTAAAGAAAGLLLLVGAYGLFYRPIGRIVLAVAILLAALAAFSSRSLALAVRRAHPRRLWLVGRSPLLATIAERLAREFPGLFEVRAIEALAGVGTDAIAGDPPGIAPDEIVLGEDGDPTPALRRLARGSRVSGDVEFYEATFRSVPIAHVTPARLIAAGLRPADDPGAALGRLVDVALVLFALVIAWPVALAAGLAIALEGGGPVLYSQLRVGRFGRPFRMHKFRTMRTDAEDGGPSFAAAADPRRTIVGRWLRRTRVDELPQLWNVLRGDMSFVGPRPERPEFVRELEQAIPYYSWRHVVRPGLTGWAQIHMPYAATLESSRRKLELDLYYVRRRSLSLDLAILLRTAASWMRGAR